MAAHSFGQQQNQPTINVSRPGPAAVHLPTPGEVTEDEEDRDNALVDEINRAGHWSDWHAATSPDGQPIRQRHWIFTDPRHPSYAGGGTIGPATPDQSLKDDSARDGAPPNEEPYFRVEESLKTDGAEPPGNPKEEPTFSTKTDEPVSTKTLPAFRIVPPAPVSTKNPLQVPTQQQLINSDLSEWKRLKDKPPIPDKHVVNPSGKRQIGRKLKVGYEILRRVPCCECGKERRPVVGYISATQLHELEREDYETKAGIIRNILRKSARRIDARLQHIRCSDCESGREGESLRIAEAS